MSNFDEVELSEYVEGSSPKQIETTNDNDEQTTTSGMLKLQNAIFIRLMLSNNILKYFKITCTRNNS
jgi:hypothetical protein